MREAVISDEAIFKLIHIMKMTRETIGQHLKYTIQTLKKNRIPSAILDAEILLSFVIKKPKEFLYTYPEKTISTKQITQLKKLVSRRAKYEPIAYLTNKQEFYGREFYVDKRVLIPRPETELLIEELRSLLPFPPCPPLAEEEAGRGLPTPINVIDIGTGSGCIAITLKLECPDLQITAIDNSLPALKVAQKNAKKLKAKIKFIHSDLLKEINPSKMSSQTKRSEDPGSRNPEFLSPIDVIVANLPYVPIEKKQHLNLPQEKSIKFEPQKALYAKNNGLELYEKLFKQIKIKHLNPKLILCEIGPGQAMQFKKISRIYFPKSTVTIKKDLAGKTRLAIIQ